MTRTALRSGDLRRRVLRASSRLGLPLPYRRRGTGWWLLRDDAVGRSIFLEGAFEPDVEELIHRLVEPGMVACDAGAHEGYFTVLLSRVVGPTGAVLAFEPSPIQLSRLRRHLRFNRCQNVTVYATALGATSRTKAELYVIRGIETGCNSLRPPSVSEPTEVVPVALTTLDDAVGAGGPERVDFIKLDVEGAELSVIDGATGTLATDRPILLCELADVRTQPWSYRSVEIYDAMVGHGYRWFALDQDGLTEADRRESFHTNLVAVPIEKVPGVLARASHRAASSVAG